MQPHRCVFFPIFTFAVKSGFFYPSDCVNYRKFQSNPPTASMIRQRSNRSTPRNPRAKHNRRFPANRCAAKTNQSANGGHKGSNKRTSGMWKKNELCSSLFANLFIQIRFLCSPSIDSNGYLNCLLGLHPLGTECLNERTLR